MPMLGTHNRYKNMPFGTRFIAGTLCFIPKKANRTNSTFGFLPTRKPTLKKPKELEFFPTLLTRYPN